MRQGRLSGSRPISKVMRKIKRWLPLLTKSKICISPISSVLTVGRCHVSKDTLDFAVVATNKVLFHQQVSNDKKGIAQFLKELRKQSKANLADCLFCLEFTVQAALRHL